VKSFTINGESVAQNQMPLTMFNRSNLQQWQSHLREFHLFSQNFHFQNDLFFSFTKLSSLVVCFENEKKKTSFHFFQHLH
jgi:hypothetical protein